MATVMTSEMALGGAALVASGERVECWILVPGRTRFCWLRCAVDEDGERVWLANFESGRERLAEVATEAVQLTDRDAARCRRAFAEIGRTERSRKAVDLAGDADFVPLAKGSGVRRDVGGRFEVSCVEPAGRR